MHQEAGCFGVVLECIPAMVAVAVTSALDIPTIGIGAGPGTSGQVLVYHDLLGMTSHPHHAKVTPKFCKQVRAVTAVLLVDWAKRLRHGTAVLSFGVSRFKVSILSRNAPSNASMRDHIM